MSVSEILEFSIRDFVSLFYVVLGDSVFVNSLSFLSSYMEATEKAVRKLFNNEFQLRNCCSRKRWEWEWEWEAMAYFMADV